MENCQRCFEFLQQGDAGGLCRSLDESPSCVDARDAGGVSLLMHCLYRGRRDLAELVAGRKAKLDIFEVTSMGRLDTLREMARGRAGLDERSADGFTALHFAAFFGQPESARVLIEAGAAVDSVAANPMKVMPLHSAASARNLEAARLLLEHGAPPNARQHGGWVAMHAAAQNGDRPMVELLLRHGADPKQTNDEGKTPGVVANEKGYKEIGDLLSD